MVTPNLLQTKFMAPRVTSSHCHRSHLVEAVTHALPQKLVILTAPPGYGKTTLMVEVVNALEQPVLWYQLDKADNDPATFLAYLVEGLRRTLPEIGDHIYEMLDGAELLPASRAIIIILNELLETPGMPWTLVLDDYHVITNPAVHELAATFIEHRPPDMQIILSTRSSPSLPLPRWRVRDQLLEIRSDSLRFSVDEALVWLTSKIPDVSQETVQSIITKTEGWGAGLQLAIVFLAESRNSDYDTVIDKLEGSHPYIFNYLMEEVFELQPEDLQIFLLKSSILNQLNASACSTVLAIENAQMLLENLERENLFLFSLDSQQHWYRYHQLFHQFLRNKLETRSPQDVRELHVRAGEYYTANGEFEEAVSHFLKAELYSHAAEVFKQFGFAYLEQGRADILQHYLDKFPVEECNQHAELGLIRGRVLRHQGKIHEAMAQLEQTTNIAERLGQTRYQALALIDLAGIARSKGDYIRSRDLSEEAVRMSAHHVPDVHALALMENAKGTGFLDGMEQGRALAENAINVTRQVGGQLTQHQKAQLLRSLGQICWWHGDVEQAVRYGQDALSNVANKQSPLAAEIMLMLSTPVLYRHQYSEALAYAQKALDICQQLQLQELLPTAYAVLGNALTRLGELPRAEQALQQAIEHAEGMGAASYAQVMAGGYLAYNLVAQNRIDEAQNVAETALWPHMGEPIVYEIFVCRSVLADIYLEKEELEQARKVFEELTIIGEARQYRIPLAMAYFGLAYIDIVQRREESGLYHATQSLELLSESRAWELYTDQGQRAVLVCRHLARYLPDNPFLRKVLEELEVPRASDFSLSMVNLHRIQVQTLGTFRIFRGKEEITDWSSSKARDMLAYFVTFRYEHITIDRALNDLWPTEESRGKAAFHTALYRLRQALRYEDEATKYITVEVGDYRLDVARFDIDVEQFEEYVRSAEQTTGDEAVVWYEKAVALYGGSYLDNLYFDWLLVERQRLEGRILAILDTLHQTYAQNRSFECALKTARSLLQINPLAEEVHCAAMQYLYALGDRKGVVDQYQHLVDLLQEELNIEPMPSSQRLYQILLEGGNQHRNSK